jgi:hypothetical protein
MSALDDGMSSFTPFPLCILGNIRHYSFVRRLGRSQSRSAWAKKCHDLAENRTSVGQLVARRCKGSQQRRIHSSTIYNSALERSVVTFEIGQTCTERKRAHVCASIRIFSAALK